MWHTRIGLNRFGLAVPGRVNATGGTMQVGTQTLVYRERWTRHRAEFKPDESSIYFRHLYISEWWLERSLAVEDRVYDGGSVGVVTVGPERRFGDGPAAASRRIRNGTASGVRPSLAPLRAVNT
jgi:hypothetical protein